VTDPLTQLALVGTSRQPEPQAPSGPPVDAVLTALAALASQTAPGEPPMPMERRVLLAAGARAVATMAGRRPFEKDAPAPGTQAPAETRPPCSPAATRLLADLLSGHREELLPEALALLDRAGKRLPHALLPDALRVRTEALRAAMRPVLGERGPWLARMHEPWAWAVAAPAAASLEELERAFTEGTASTRHEVLARARSLDAAKARAWLEATWSSEKADERAALLACLHTGLSPADEPFIEAQLRDRAGGVRETAQSLLAHLPESAFVRRMTARADAMLSFQRSALARVGLGKRGALAVSPPDAMDGDADADRDGLGKPPQGLGVGARAFWLTRTLASVPLAHWTARFGASAADLVAAAEATDWAGAVCEGWARSAIVSASPEWLGALWDMFQRSDEKTVASSLAVAMASCLLQKMEPADAAARVEALFAGGAPRAGRMDFGTALVTLPSPWPSRLGHRWVEMARRELQGGAGPSAILATVRFAALALPVECFEPALALADALTADSIWAGPLADFVDVVRLRHDLVKEIAS